MEEYKPKPFWKRPEGVTGGIVLGLLVVGGGILLASIMPTLLALAQTTLYLAIMLLVLGVIAYMVLDPRTRNLIGYMYKSLMRWITGLFVQVDPIGILKNYVEELRGNLDKMDRQIIKLRSQMNLLKEQILNNQKTIRENIEIASKAKESNQRTVMILKSRKAGRLKESNLRLEDLYKRMEVLYRVLQRMYENSSILAEDIADQVKVKEQERKAIHASHSAMKSAMNIISGNKDQRYMFDQALEAIADDVSKKVGEMERFMELSENFMQSVDLKNGIFEEEGLKMLDKWEKEGESFLLGTSKKDLLLEAEDDSNVLDINQPVKKPVRAADHKNQYDSFFD